MNTPNRHFSLSRRQESRPKWPSKSDSFEDSRAALAFMSLAETTMLLHNGVDSIQLAFVLWCPMLLRQLQFDLVTLHVGNVMIASNGSGQMD